MLWDKHWKRLLNDTQKLEIDISAYKEKDVLNALSDVLIKNKVEMGRARVSFTDDRPGNLWRFDNEGETRLTILSTGQNKAANEMRIGISPFHVNSRSPLAGTKSTNYLENILALNEARARGFDECIRLNENGDISSACMANVFWLKEDRLFTPHLETGCVPGTTRAFITEKLDCEEVRAGLGDISSADAVFLTSAGLGVVRVKLFETHQFKEVDHPILELINFCS